MIAWPHGKTFAFTVFDDTDWSTRENASPVYDFLADCGFRTTKSVWPLRGTRRPRVGGATCDDPEYLRWVKSLAARGFEIAYHMATFHTSTREETERGLERFRREFGGWPRTMANHADCEENIYWGDARLSGLNRAAYNVLTRGRNRGRFRGHIEGDPLFWGDLCRQRISYVRNFVFPETNTLTACPRMPYRDPERPFVAAWFASSAGGDVGIFNETLSETGQERLETEGGACIMYTHFAKGFVEDGRVHPRFAELLKRLADRPGWFVPAATLLDFLVEYRGIHTLTDKERSALERRWLVRRARRGGEAGGVAR